MEVTETKIIRKIIAEISKVLSENGNDAQLISLKAIYPRDSKLDTLKSILALSKSVPKKEYQTLDNAFVYGDPKIANGTIKHTLTFLKYPDYVKYKEIENSSDSATCFDELEFHNEEDIKLNSSTEVYK